MRPLVVFSGLLSGSASPLSVFAAVSYAHLKRLAPRMAFDPVFSLALQLSAAPLGFYGCTGSVWGFMPSPLGIEVTCPFWWHRIRHSPAAVVVERRAFQTSAGALVDFCDRDHHWVLSSHKEGVRSNTFTCS